MELKESEINYVFDIEQLVKGDILIINEYDEVFTKRLASKYTHIALYMGDAFIIESHGSGVCVSHLYSYGFKENDDGKVFRVNNLCPEDADRVIEFMSNSLGMEWNGKHAIDAMKNNNDKYVNSTYCSKLVAQAYASINIPLVANPMICKPTDFLDLKNGHYLNNPLSHAEEYMKKNILDFKKERDSASNIESLTDLYQSLNKVYYPKEQDLQIQTFNQILECIFKYPEKDRQASVVIKNSNYFNVEKLKRDCPWFWNDEEFLKEKNTTERRFYFTNNERLHLRNTFYPFVQKMIDELFLLNLIGSLSILELYNGFCRIKSYYLEVDKRLEHLMMLSWEKDSTNFETYIDMYLKK